MSAALVLMLPGRPSVVPYHGGYVYVGVHDEWFLRQVTRLRHQIRDTHPDRRAWTRIGLQVGRSRALGPVTRVAYPNRCGAFRLAQHQLDVFLRKEIRWYRRLGLAPPDTRHLICDDGRS